MIALVLIAALGAAPPIQAQRLRLEIFDAESVLALHLRAIPPAEVGAGSRMLQENLGRETDRECTRIALEEVKGLQRIAAPLHADPDGLLRLRFIAEHARERVAHLMICARTPAKRPVAHPIVQPPRHVPFASLRLHRTPPSGIGFRL